MFPYAASYEKCYRIVLLIPFDLMKFVLPTTKLSGRDMLNQYRRSNIFYRARHLRRNMTKAERILWINLRKRSCHYKFRRQVPIGKYIADFLCVELKLIIEVDGESHLLQKSYDAKRTRWLENRGYHVIRVTNEVILSGSEKVYQEILDVCLKLSG